MALENTDELCMIPLVAVHAVTVISACSAGGRAGSVCSLGLLRRRIMVSP